MAKILLAMLLPLIALPVLAQEIRNFDVSGNLPRTHRLDCRSLAELQAVFSPADLAPVVTDCLVQSRYEDAMQVLFHFSIYGRLDALRVADTTAH